MSKRHSGVAKQAGRSETRTKAFHLSLTPEPDEEDEDDDDETDVLRVKPKKLFPPETPGMDGRPSSRFARATPHETEGRRDG